MKALTTEEFIKRSQVIFENRYIYNETVYINRLNKVSIICRIHGSFEQYPGNHLAGKHCKKCSSITGGRLDKNKRNDLNTKAIKQPPEFKLIKVDNFYSKVSNKDFDKVKNINWNISGGYARNKKYGTLHKFIKECPQDLFIDHINRDKLDNRQENLRVVTRSENNCNRPPFKNKSSNYKGVKWHKGNKKWASSIGINNTRKHLGYFKDEKEAAIAYNNAALIYHGEFAYLNIVE